MKKIKAILAVLLILVVATGCSNSKETNAKEEKNLKIVTTFYPMYNITQNIVGEEAEVFMLISGNTEPHDYEPSAKDIAKIQDADIFIYNSKDMETWVDSVLASVDLEKTTVIEASKGIKFMEFEGEAHEHEGHEDEEKEHADHDHNEHDHEGHQHVVDPHVWLDPVLVKEEAKTITDGIKKVDKENTEYYDKSSKIFSQKLADLDQSYKEAFENATNRTFVTQHAAFAYLAKRYNLHQESISGISPDQEPSPAELAKMEKYVKENKVEVIYTEELASEKIAQTIADATGAKLENLSTLEGLSKKDRDKGMDYISIMERNLEALKLAIK